MAKKKYEVKAHVLVPKHAKVSESEKKTLLSRYNITIAKLPKISVKDPAIKDLDVRAGDIVKITRKSQTSGETVYYRGVMNE